MSKKRKQIIPIESSVSIRGKPMIVKEIQLSVLNKDAPVLVIVREK